MQLLIGSGPIATLVQSGTVRGVGGAAATGTLGAPSVGGTLLVALIGNNNNVDVSGYPAGWVAGPFSQQNPSTLRIAIYPNNPGGISAATFTLAGLAGWDVNLSEWSNASLTGILDSSGTATATAGTTLTLATSASLSVAGDVAISAWEQRTAGNTPNYTTPVGWTRLGTDGSTFGTFHLDAEYLINPPLGPPLAATLTSDTTTLTAAGAIIVLTAASPATDQTAYLQHGSLTVKLNTADFTLIDPALASTLTAKSSRP